MLRRWLKRRPEQVSIAIETLKVFLAASTHINLAINWPKAHTRTAYEQDERSRAAGSRDHVNVTR